MIAGRYSDCVRVRGLPVALVAGVFVTLSFGIFYAWSVFIEPMAQHLGCEQENVSVIYTIQMCAFCIGGIISGRMKASDAKLITILSLSALLISGGFFITSIANNIKLVYIAYGIAFGTGIGLGYTTIIGTAMDWIPEKKGIILGILMMGYGMGSLVWGTVCIKLMEVIELQHLFKIISLLLLAILLSGGMVLNRFDAAVKKQKLSNVDYCKNERFVETLQGTTPKELIKSKLFYLFYIWLFFYAVCGQAFISNVSPMAVSIGTSSMTAAVIVGMTAVFNGVGRIFIGNILDKLKTEKVMLVLSVYLVIVLLIVEASMIAENVILFTVGAVLMGISFSGIPITMSVFVAEIWGDKFYTANYSLANTCMIPQSLLGVLMFTKIVAGNGTYLPGIGFLLVLAVLLVCNTVMIRKYNNG